MAAIVALISSLCISRKKPVPTTSQPKTTQDLKVATASPKEATTIETTMTEAATMEAPSAALGESDNTKERPQLPLPPPPGMTQLRGSASYHYRSSSSASSERKLLSSMSVRAQGGGGMGQMSRKEESSHDKKRDKKLKHEDSVWKKTIILGERCRVPDEDDTVVYDEKGNRISTYHPKTPSSLPVSRQTSFIDPDAIPISGQK
ncbi:hypothetical protein Vadar_023913 [Vaccinium darrowii]|uniref:Uncharacterized protein n=1 Tax=Vaccinium darrowii TaxID=229202 RepID=A0ACB7X3P9_9ERIC|nr:hypothetical protein Vadar_023913 [Vaccinium darrowii]